MRHTFTLANGVEIPAVGFGTYKAAADNDEAIISEAIRQGYRHLDTAAFYFNEEAVGKAVRESGIPREEFFLTSKVWRDRLGYDSTLREFEESCKKLGTDYLDLYLIHWPRPDDLTAEWKDLDVETWKALEDLYKSKKVRAIGVSNFQIHHLKELWRASGEIPAVNQIESHPLLTQYPLLEYCAEKDIACQAWSPLGGEGGAVLKEEAVVSVAAKHGKSPAQVVLRWDLQRGIVPLPRSTRKERIISNLDIFDFELDDADMAAIDALDRGHRFGPDPDNFSL